MDLASKNALVTGGSMGLGETMAMAFYGASANVILVARRESELEQTKAEIEASADNGATVLTCPCDVADVRQIESSYQNVVANVGHIDILVNNAGKSEAHRFMDVTDEIWQNDLDLKLRAAIPWARLVFPMMCEQKWGPIINILNIAAKAPGPGSAPTSVSRATGMALTKVLAGEGAPHNVLVNALLIGRIESDQSRRAYDASPRDINYEEYLNRAGASLPMGRMGEARECGNVALFLASDMAS